MRINLNADMGESFGPYVIGNDEALLEVVASANVACGFHGGDPVVIGRTMAAAGARGVSVGAHPGYADLQGFGRRKMSLPDNELTCVLQYQIGAAAALAQAQGRAITHVKPHGALSNQACADRAMADVVARAVAALDRRLILLAPALSKLAAAGNAAGLSVALEAFADRSYEPDGQLSPRGAPGAVLKDPAAAADHVAGMVAAGGLRTREGAVLETPVHSVCVHGDGAQALAVARAVRAGLEAEGHRIVPLPELTL